LNANRVNASWGWVPWEPVLEAVDRIGGPAISPAPADAPVATAK